VIEGLFAADLSCLEDLYRRINQNGHGLVHAQCPQCECHFDLEVSSPGGPGATP